MKYKYVVYFQKLCVIYFLIIQIYIEKIYIEYLSEALQDDEVYDVWAGCTIVCVFKY